MTAIIYVVNAILVSLIFRYEYYSQSDKTIVITAALFVVLFAINLLAGLTLQIRKMRGYQHFYISGFLLLIAAVGAFFLW